MPQARLIPSAPLSNVTNIVLCHQVWLFPYIVSQRAFAYLFIGKNDRKAVVNILTGRTKPSSKLPVLSIKVWKNYPNLPVTQWKITPIQILTERFYIRSGASWATTTYYTKFHQKSPLSIAWTDFLLQKHNFNAYMVWVHYFQRVHGMPIFLLFEDFRQDKTKKLTKKISSKKPKNRHFLQLHHKIK